MKFILNRQEAEIKTFASPGTYTVSIQSVKDGPLDRNGDIPTLVRYRADDGSSIVDRFYAKETQMWRVNLLANVTTVDLPDGQEFDLSKPGALTNLLQHWVGQRLSIVIDQDGEYLRVKRLNKAPEEAF